MTHSANDQPFDRSVGDREPYAPPERMQAAWSVSVSGVTFAMVGEKCRKSEALAAARVIWPYCEIDA